MPEIVTLIVAATIGVVFIHVIHRVAWLAMKLGAAVLAVGVLTVTPGLSEWLETPVAEVASNTPGAPELPGFEVVPTVPNVDLGVELGNIAVNQFTATVFGAHLVAGLVVMALTYVVMERWYTGSVLVTPVLVGSVAFVDDWLLSHHVQPLLYGVTVEQTAFAAAIGFAVGLLAVTVVFEPEFQSRTTGSTDSSNSANEAFQRLNL